jgi:hypothetical protein
VRDSSGWREDIAKAIEEGSIGALLDCIARHATAHAGTPPAAVKREIARRLTRYRSGETLAAMACDLLQSESPGGQEVGTLLLPAALPYRRSQLLSLLADIAQSPHWEVREWAGSALGIVLALPGEDVRGVTHSWAASDSERLRRAAVIALMEYGKECPGAELPWVLDELGRMLEDPSSYVQTNLGPFAIGSALAARDPEGVAARLRSWVRTAGDRGRVQIALVFSAAAGSNLASLAEDVLDLLAKDPSPQVQRALKKAQRSIARNAAPPSPAQ